MSEASSFKTAIDAVQWLKMQGFKASAAQFSRHFRAGRIARNEEGLFTASALLGYAAVCLQPVARIDDAESRSVALGKMSADSELKSVRAARERLKLEKEQGKLMSVEVHEQDLAARAVFFKSEVESFIHRKAGEIIALVGGREGAVPELVAWWEEATADWFDAFSQESSFVSEEEEEEGEEDEPEADGD